MLAVDKGNGDYLYRQVIDLIAENIETGTLKPGDRLPSLRRMSKRIGVSVPTVRQAYVELERQRRVESRPQSGFYVRGVKLNDIVRPAPRFRRNAKPSLVRGRSLMDRVYEGLYQPGVVPLGIANPCMARPAAKALNRAMKRVMSRAEDRSLAYAPTIGEPGLRRQIAFRQLDTLGSRVDPDDICITNGAQEALLLALRCVAQKGDVIAVESPTYHGLLELIDSLGMLAIEVETCPEEGVMLDALRKTLDTHPVRVCMFSTTLCNPLGVSMPEEKRRELAEIIDQRDIVLIEDDVYGELLFDGHRPKPVEAYSRSGRVMTCGSFSKTAAPGYRIGWLLSGQYRDKVNRLKRSYSCSSGLLQQLTLAEFMAGGDYDRYLKSLRPVLQTNAERMRGLVAEHFPRQTRTSKPVGGSVLWVELPESVDSEELFEAAISAGISIAPGSIFSPCRRYRNFARLSFGHQWSDDIDAAVGWLGKKVRQMQ
ncbi:MAG: PLP-dependent aminotransferase family protein [Gammaproteobacteria bacterium]|nr:PLP-dependent aminotransferase family protein [Gammaproteobacteria bacterium]MDH4313892.1 PLP-dependent aminotransferase family protein [Gammaproteobacteria bacterium]MDH5213833.1 PLP-dependent aminotransferase family protein [Gammaproteobacteria bacterium]